MLSITHDPVQLDPKKELERFILQIEKEEEMRLFSFVNKKRYAAVAKERIKHLLGACED
jgi:hypothetical protein